MHGQWHETHVPKCARKILSQAGLELLCTSSGEKKPMSHIAHAYLIHYTRNINRLSFQREQLPRLLGLNVSVVTSYDADVLNETIRGCLLGPPPEPTWRDVRTPESAPYASQSIKLYVALWDMAIRSFESALVLEDDAMVRPHHLPRLEGALSSLAGNFSVVHAGGYMSSGLDSLALGTHMKPTSLRHRPGCMMAAVGNVISARGVLNLLSCLPIVAEIDRTLSDSRLCGGQGPGHWYVKQYAFVPAPLPQTRRESIPRDFNKSFAT